MQPAGQVAHAPDAQGERPIDAKQLAATVAHLLDEKKALDIQVIDVGERLKVADYFVVCTGQNRTHVRALYNELHVRLKAAGEQHLPVQGNDLGWWVVVDYTDVVVHILQPDAREFYDIERLYDECDRLDWASLEPPAIQGGAAG
ncbi:MAG: ribosome silencing factor [Planctomycetota bacterium]